MCALARESGRGGGAGRLDYRWTRRHDKRQRPLDGCAGGAAAGATQDAHIGVSNQGIGGNHLLTDGLGPNVLARFDRDVLAPAGVRWVIVFEGVNDLGGLARTGEVPAERHAALVERVIAAYRADYRAGACARAARLRRDDHAVRGIGLLPSGAAERGGPGGSE